MSVWTGTYERVSYDTDTTYTETYTQPRWRRLLYRLSLAAELWTPGSYDRRVNRAVRSSELERARNVHIGDRHEPGGLPAYFAALDERRAKRGG